MDAKEYLQQIIPLKLSIRDNEKKVKFLREKVNSITSNLSPDKVQSSANKDKIGNAVSEYVDIEHEIVADKAAQKEILDTIKMLKPYEKSVISQYYVNDKTLGEIASDMNRSYSWVSKKHSSGIDHIQEILDKKRDK
jgi:DNA-directed RNA polymerase specialized sigma subunit